jgi:hypothetical protein
MYGFDSFTSRGGGGGGGDGDRDRDSDGNRDSGNIPKDTVFLPVPPVDSDVQLVQGWFAHTLPSFLAQHTGEFVGFANIDVDFAEDTLYVLEQLLPHLRKGSVLHFHEFFTVYTQYVPGQYVPGEPVPGDRQNKGYVLGDEQMRALHQWMQVHKHLLNPSYLY